MDQPSSPEPLTHEWLNQRCAFTVHWPPNVAVRVAEVPYLPGTPSLHLYDYGFSDEFIYPGACHPVGFPVDSTRYSVGLFAVVKYSRIKLYLVTAAYWKLG
ncbi:MAG: hypothetical protein QOD12_2841 [Verrucomicrobiota bacterium]